MTKLVYYGKWFRAFCKSFYKYWEARVPKAGTIEAWTRGCDRVTGAPKSNIVSRYDNSLLYASPVNSSIQDFLLVNYKFKDCRVEICSFSVN